MRRVRAFFAATLTGGLCLICLGCSGTSTPTATGPTISQEKMTAQMREMAEKNQQKAREMENKKKAEDTAKEGTGKPKTDAGKGDGKDK